MKRRLDDRDISDFGPFDSVEVEGSSSNSGFHIGVFETNDSSIAPRLSSLPAVALSSGDRRVVARQHCGALEVDL